MARGTPPVFKGNLNRWATDLVSWLVQPQGLERVLPKPVYLQHKLGNEIAAEAGVVMYDPTSGVPVMANGTEWVPVGVGFGQMNWKGHYPAGGPDYLKNDVVYDNGYTMIALRDTSTRPAPVSAGEPTYTFPDVPTWTALTNSNRVFTGLVVTPPADTLAQIVSYRFWVTDAVANYHYDVWAIDASDPNNLVYTKLLDVDGDALSAGWNEIPINGTLLVENDDFAIILEVLNSSSNVQVTGQWTADAPSQSVAPLSENWNHDNQNATLRIDDDDATSTDRSIDLASITSGSTVAFVEAGEPLRFARYTVLADPIDQGTHFEYSVTLDALGPAGEPRSGELCDMTATTPVASTTNYVQLTDGALPLPNASGVISLTGDFADRTLNDNAYGVDLKIQHYITSPDWQLVSYSGIG